MVRAEKMLDRHRQRVDTTMSELLTLGFLQKKSGRGSLLNRPSCPLDDPIVKGTARAEGQRTVVCNFFQVMAEMWKIVGLKSRLAV